MSQIIFYLIFSIACRDKKIKTEIRKSFESNLLSLFSEVRLLNSDHLRLLLLTLQTIIVRFIAVPISNSSYHY